MAKPRFPPSLVNSYHALAILGGIAFVVALLAPGTVGSLGGYASLLGPPLFLGALALISAILGVHVGGTEEAWWRERPLSPRAAVARLVALTAVGQLLLAPFLFGFRGLIGGPWSGALLVQALLIGNSLAWAGVGYIAGGGLKSTGLRFVGVYGILFAVHFVPLAIALPVSPLTASLALWDLKLGPGLVGLLLWLGLAVLGLGGVWGWKRSRF